MRQEGLDPKGKVELARMLLQIGFKAEAIAEYIMAAQMYEERGDEDQAINLYEKVVDLDKDNQVAQRALYKLKPRSARDIDDMVAKIGLGPQPVPVTPVTRNTPPVTRNTPPVIPATPEEPVSEEGIAVEEPLPTEPVSGQKTSPPQEQITPPPVSAEAQPSVEAKPAKGKGWIDLASISLEESLASLVPLLKHTPDELKQRKELASFFRDEGLWSEAFFEARPAYLHKPSVDRLNELLSILLNSGDKDALTSFLLTESFIDREPELKIEVLKRLTSLYEAQGLLEEVRKTAQKLKALEGGVQRKKNTGVKIIEDVPRLSDEKTTPKGKKKKPSDPIQFV